MMLTAAAAISNYTSGVHLTKVLRQRFIALLSLHFVNNNRRFMMLLKV